MAQDRRHLNTVNINFSLKGTSAASKHFDKMVTDMTNKYEGLKKAKEDYLNAHAKNETPDYDKQVQQFDSDIKAAKKDMDAAKAMQAKGIKDFQSFLGFISRIEQLGPKHLKPLLNIINKSIAGLGDLYDEAGNPIKETHEALQFLTKAQAEVDTRLKQSTRGVLDFTKVLDRETASYNELNTAVSTFERLGKSAVDDRIPDHYQKMAQAMLKNRISMQSVTGEWRALNAESTATDYQHTIRSWQDMAHWAQKFGADIREDADMMQAFNAIVNRFGTRDNWELVSTQETEQNITAMQGMGRQLNLSSSQQMALERALETGRMVQAQKQGQDMERRAMELYGKNYEHLGGMSDAFVRQETDNWKRIVESTERGSEAWLRYRDIYQTLLRESNSRKVLNAGSILVGDGDMFARKLEEERARTAGLQASKDALGVEEREGKVIFKNAEEEERWAAATERRAKAGEHAAAITEKRDQLHQVDLDLEEVRTHIDSNTVTVTDGDLTMPVTVELITPEYYDAEIERISAEEQQKKTRITDLENRHTKAVEEHSRAVKENATLQQELNELELQKSQAVNAQEKENNRIAEAKRSEIDDLREQNSQLKKQLKKNKAAEEGGGIVSEDQVREAEAILKGDLAPLLREVLDFNPKGKTAEELDAMQQKLRAFKDILAYKSENGLMDDTVKRAKQLESLLGSISLRMQDLKQEGLEDPTLVAMVRDDESNDPLEVKAERKLSKFEAHERHYTQLGMRRLQSHGRGLKGYIKDASTNDDYIKNIDLQIEDIKRQRESLKHAEDVVIEMSEEDENELETLKGNIADYKEQLSWIGKDTTEMEADLEDKQQKLSELEKKQKGIIKRHNAAERGTPERRALKAEYNTLSSQIGEQKEAIKNLADRINKVQKLNSSETTQTSIRQSLAQAEEEKASIEKKYQSARFQKTQNSRQREEEDQILATQQRELIELKEKLKKKNADETVALSDGEREALRLIRTSKTKLRNQLTAYQTGDESKNPAGARKKKYEELADLQKELQEEKESLILPDYEGAVKAQSDAILTEKKRQIRQSDEEINNELAKGIKFNGTISGPLQEELDSAQQLAQGFVNKLSGIVEARPDIGINTSTVASQFHDIENQFKTIFSSIRYQEDAEFRAVIDNQWKEYQGLIADINKTKLKGKVVKIPVKDELGHVKIGEDGQEVTKSVEQLTDKMLKGRIPTIIDSLQGVKDSLADVTRSDELREVLENLDEIPVKMSVMGDVKHDPFTNILGKSDNVLKIFDEIASKDNAVGKEAKSTFGNEAEKLRTAVANYKSAMAEYDQEGNLVKPADQEALQKYGDELISILRNMETVRKEFAGSISQHKDNLYELTRSISTAYEQSTPKNFRQNRYVDKDTKREIDAVEGMYEEMFSSMKFAKNEAFAKQVREMVKADSQAIHDAVKDYRDWMKTDTSGMDAEEVARITESKHDAVVQAIATAKTNATDLISQNDTRTVEEVVQGTRKTNELEKEHSSLIDESHKKTENEKQAIRALNKLLDERNKKLREGEKIRESAVNSQGKPGKIIFAKDAMDRMAELTNGHTESETGGRLFGRIAEDGTKVVQFVLSPQQNDVGKEHHFRLGELNSRIAKVLEDQGLVDLGNWHTHPDDTAMRQASAADVTKWNKQADKRGADIIGSIAKIHKDGTISVDSYSSDGKVTQQLETQLAEYIEEPVQLATEALLKDKVKFEYVPAKAEKAERGHMYTTDAPEELSLRDGNGIKVVRTGTVKKPDTIDLDKEHEDLVKTLVAQATAELGDIIPKRKIKQLVKNEIENAVLSEYKSRDSHDIDNWYATQLNAPAQGATRDHFGGDNRKRIIQWFGENKALEEYAKHRNDAYDSTVRAQYSEEQNKIITQAQIAERSARTPLDAIISELESLVNDSSDKDKGTTLLKKFKEQREWVASTTAKYDIADEGSVRKSRWKGRKQAAEENAQSTERELIDFLGTTKATEILRRYHANWDAYQEKYTASRKAGVEIAQQYAPKTVAEIGQPAAPSADIPDLTENNKNLKLFVAALKGADAVVGKTADEIAQMAKDIVDKNKDTADSFEEVTVSASQSDGDSIDTAATALDIIRRHKQQQETGVTADSSAELQAQIDKNDEQIETLKRAIESQANQKADLQELDRLYEEKKSKLKDLTELEEKANDTSYKEEIDQLNADLDTLQDQREDANKRLSESNKLLNTQTELLSKKEKLEEEIAQLEGGDAEQAADQQIISRKEELGRQLGVINEQLDENRRNIELFERKAQEASTVDFSQFGLDTIQSAMDVWQDEMRKCFDNDGKLIESEKEHWSELNAQYQQAREYLKSIANAKKIADIAAAYDKRHGMEAEELRALAQQMQQVITAEQMLGHGTDELRQKLRSLKDEIFSKEMGKIDERINEAFADGKMPAIATVDDIVKKMKRLRIEMEEAGMDVTALDAKLAGMKGKGYDVATQNITDLGSDDIATRTRHDNEEIKLSVQYLQMQRDALFDNTKMIQEQSAEWQTVNNLIRQGEDYLRAVAHAGKQNDIARQFSTMTENGGNVQMTIEQMKSLKAEMEKCSLAARQLGQDSTKMDEDIEKMDEHIRGAQESLRRQMYDASGQISKEGVLGLKPEEQKQMLEFLEQLAREAYAAGDTTLFAAISRESKQMKDVIDGLRNATRAQQGEDMYNDFRANGFKGGAKDMQVMIDNLKQYRDSLDITTEDGKALWKEVHESIVTLEDDYKRLTKASEMQSMEIQFAHLSELTDDALKKQGRYWLEMMRNARVGSQEFIRFSGMYGDVKSEIKSRGENMLAALETKDIASLSAAEIQDYISGLREAYDILDASDAKYKDIGRTIDKLESRQAELNARMAEWTDDAMKLGEKDFDAKNFNGSIHDLENYKKALETRLKNFVRIPDDKDNAKELKKTERALRNVNGLLEQSGQRVKKYGTLSEATYTQISNAAKRGSTAVRMEMDKAHISTDDLKASIDRMRDSLNNGSFFDENSTKSYIQQFNEMAAAIRNADQQYREMTSSERSTIGYLDKAWEQLKTHFGTYVGLASVVREVPQQFQANLQLSDTMADVRKVTGMTRDEVSALSDQLAELGTRTELTDLLNLAYQGGKMGIGADLAGEAKVTELGQFTQAAEKINMALGEDFGGTEAIGALAKLTDVMRVSQTEGYNTSEALERAGSSILALGNSSTASYDNINAFATRLGGIAASANISIPELLALGSTLDSLGLKTEMSATAISKFITQLVKNPQKISAAIGATKEESEALENMVWNGHTTQAMEMTFQILHRNQADLESISTRLKDLSGGDGQRVLAVLTSMAQGADTFTKHLQISTDAYRENMAIANEYDVKNNDAMASMQRIRNAFNEAFVRSGVSNVIEDFLHGIAEMSENWDHFVGAVLTSMAALYVSIKTYSGQIAKIQGMLGSVFSTTWITQGLSALRTGLSSTLSAVTALPQTFMNGMRAMKAGWTTFTEHLRFGGRIAFGFIVKQMRQAFDQLRLQWHLGKMEGRGFFAMITMGASAASQALSWLREGFKKLMAATIYTLAIQVAFEALYAVIMYVKDAIWSTEEDIQDILSDIAASAEETLSGVEKEMQGYEDRLKKITEAHNANAEAKNQDAAATKELASTEQDDTAAKLQEADAAEDVAKSEKERLSLINDLNSNYGQYLGFIMDETTKMYQLADAIAYVTSKRKEDAMASALASVDSKAEEKFGKDSADALSGIENTISNILKRGGGNTALSGSFASSITKWVRDYIKKNPNVDWADIKNDRQARADLIGALVDLIWKKKVQATGADGKRVYLKTSTASQLKNDIISDVLKYAANEGKRNSYVTSATSDLKGRLAEQKESTKAVSEATLREQRRGMMYQHDATTGQLILDSNGKPIAMANVPKADIKGAMDAVAALRRLERTEGISEDRLTAQREIIKQIEKDWGYQQQGELLKAMEKDKRFNSEDIRLQRAEYHTGLASYNDMLRSRKEYYTPGQWQSLVSRGGILYENEKRIGDIRRENQWDQYLDISRKTGEQIKPAYDNLREAWAKVNPLKPETIKKFNALTGNTFASYEKAEEWTMDVKKQMEDQAKRLHLTTELQWDRPKKGRDNTKSKQNEELNKAKQQMEAYINELKAYYVEQEQMLNTMRVTSQKDREEMVAKGLISEKQAMEQELIEAEEFNARKAKLDKAREYSEARLRNMLLQSSKQFNKSIAALSADELKTFFKDNGSSIQDTGRKLVRLGGDALVDEIYRKSKENLNKVTEIMVKREETFEKALLEKRPLEKVIHDFRAKMNDLHLIFGDADWGLEHTEKEYRERIDVMQGFAARILHMTQDEFNEELRATQLFSKLDTEEMELLYASLLDLREQYDDAARKEAKQEIKLLDNRIGSGQWYADELRRYENYLAELRKLGKQETEAYLSVAKAVDMLRARQNMTDASGVTLSYTKRQEAALKALNKAKDREDAIKNAGVQNGVHAGRAGLAVAEKELQMSIDTLQVRQVEADRVVYEVLDEIDKTRAEIARLQGAGEDTRGMMIQLGVLQQKLNAAEIKSEEYVKEAQDKMLEKEKAMADAEAQLWQERLSGMKSYQDAFRDSISQMSTARINAYDDKAFELAELRAKKELGLVSDTEKQRYLIIKKNGEKTQKWLTEEERIEEEIRINAANNRAEAITNMLKTFGEKLNEALTDAINRRLAADKARKDEEARQQAIQDAQYTGIAAQMDTEASYTQFYHDELMKRLRMVQDFYRSVGMVAGSPNTLVEGSAAPGFANGGQLSVGNLPKFATGGFVKGLYTKGDRILVRTNAGEAVLTPKQQRVFMDLANGRIGFGDANAVRLIEGMQSNQMEMRSLIAEFKNNKNFIWAAQSKWNPKALVEEKDMPGPVQDSTELPAVTVAAKKILTQAERLDIIGNLMDNAGLVLDCLLPVSHVFSSSLLGIDDLLDFIPLNRRKNIFEQMRNMMLELEEFDPNKAVFAAKGKIGIAGPGTETSDSIPAMLSRGESVITAEGTRKNRAILEAINNGEVFDLIRHRFADGAISVGSKTLKAGLDRQMTTGGDININIDMSGIDIDGLIASTQEWIDHIDMLDDSVLLAATNFDGDTIKKLLKKVITNDDIRAIIDAEGDDRLEYIQNGINRYIDKAKNAMGMSNDEKTEIKKADLIIPEGSQYGIIPASYIGQNKPAQRPVTTDQYIAPESINTADATFAPRNRYDQKELNTEGLIITSFYPFFSYEDVIKGALDVYKSAAGYTETAYYGIDKSGKLKVGQMNDFERGDMMTMTFVQRVAEFVKQNGDYVYTAASGNPGLKNPMVKKVDKNGKVSEQVLQLLISNSGDSSTYGSVSGGRYLMQAGNEIRHVSGSLDDINAQLEDMKKRHNVPFVTLYEEDGGTYVQGLRTSNKTISAAAQRAYDKRNPGGGGHGLYLTNNPMSPASRFAEKKIEGANVRKNTDDSYKNGHSLTNEQKGITLHHTGEYPLESVLRSFTNPTTGTSAHAVIDKDGTRYILADPSQVTFHAGESSWKGRSSVNDFMVGVEFMGDTNKADLTESQIESFLEYAIPIIRKNNISLEDIVSHQMVAPGRKPDINQRNYERIIGLLKDRLYYPLSDDVAASDKAAKAKAAKRAESDRQARAFMDKYSWENTKTPAWDFKANLEALKEAASKTGKNTRAGKQSVSLPPFTAEQTPAWDIEASLETAKAASDKAVQAAKTAAAKATEAQKKQAEAKKAKEDAAKAKADAERRRLALERARKERETAEKAVKAEAKALEQAKARAAAGQGQTPVPAPSLKEMTENPSAQAIQSSFSQSMDDIILLQKKYNVAKAEADAKKAVETQAKAEHNAAKAREQAAMAKAEAAESQSKIADIEATAAKEERKANIDAAKKAVQDVKTTVVKSQIKQAGSTVVTDGKTGAAPASGAAAGKPRTSGGKADKIAVNLEGLKNLTDQLPEITLPVTLKVDDITIGDAAKEDTAKTDTSKPIKAAIATKQYDPTLFLVNEADRKLAREMTSFADMLKEAGYQVNLFGDAFSAFSTSGQTKDSFWDALFDGDAWASVGMSALSQAVTISGSAAMSKLASDWLPELLGGKKKSQARMDADNKLDLAENALDTAKKKQKAGGSADAQDAVDAAQARYNQALLERDYTKLWEKNLKEERKAAAKEGRANDFKAVEEKTMAELLKDKDKYGDALANAILGGGATAPADKTGTTYARQEASEVSPVEAALEGNSIAEQQLAIETKSAEYLASIAGEKFVNPNERQAEAPASLTDTEQRMGEFMDYRRVDTDYLMNTKLTGEGKLGDNGETDGTMESSAGLLSQEQIENQEMLIGQLVQVWIDGFGAMGDSADAYMLKMLNNTEALTDESKEQIVAQVNTTRSADKKIVKAGEEKEGKLEKATEARVSAQTAAEQIGGQMATGIGDMVTQASGNQMLGQLSATLAKAGADSIAGIGSGAAKTIGELGWWGIPLVASIQAVIGALLGAVTSRIGKSKQQISQATGASSGRLSTGMLTYAEGRYAGDEDDTMSAALASLSPYRQGQSYTVHGNDGEDYDAVFEGRNLETGLRKGEHFGIFSEKKPEIVIDGDTTKTILSKYPGLYNSILDIAQGKDPMLSLDYAYIQKQLGKIDMVRTMGHGNLAKGMPTFAAGSYPDGYQDIDGVPAGATGTGTAGMSGGGELQELLLEVLTDLRDNGVQSNISMRTLDKKQKQLDRWKKQNGVK